MRPCLPTGRTSDGCACRQRSMSIEKESSGLPEIDLHRRTTKVNLGVIAGAVLFLIITTAVIVYLSQQA